MALNTIFFCFVFLPISGLLYLVTPVRGRYITLTGISLLFFAWGNPQNLILILLSLVLNYCAGHEMAEHLRAGRKKEAKRALLFAVIVNLAVLVFYKYYGMVQEGLHLPVFELGAPAGLSFYTFSLLSYLFDVYREKADFRKNPLHFAFYVLFFPKLLSGPIVRYQVLSNQIGHEAFDLRHIGEGSQQFIVGLAKKVLIADVLGKVFYPVAALSMEQVSTATAWIGALSYSLMLYFDFSGYSDMAIGIGKMFGYDFGKNFDYPYTSTTVSEFWRRWHITLGLWFREYVYIPMGGNRVSRGRHALNLLVVWALTGIWHGATLPFLIWGLYYGLILILEKNVTLPLLEHLKFGQILWKNIYRVIVLLIVVVGWVFFFSEDLGTAFTWIGRMFGSGTGFDATAAYYLASGWRILLIAALGACPVVPLVWKILQNHPDIQKLHLLDGNRSGFVVAVLLLVLLGFSVAAMLSSTYSSFLYFQF